MDPFDILSALKDMQQSWKDRPLELARRQADLALKLQEATLEELKEFLSVGKSETGSEPGRPDVLDALKSAARSPGGTTPSTRAGSGS